MFSGLARAPTQSSLTAECARSPALADEGVEHSVGAVGSPSQELGDPWADGCRG